MMQNNQRNHETGEQVHGSGWVVVAGVCVGVAVSALVLAGPTWLKPSPTTGRQFAQTPVRRPAPPQSVGGQPTDELAKPSVEPARLRQLLERNEDALRRLHSDRRWNFPDQVPALIAAVGHTKGMIETYRTQYEQAMATTHPRTDRRAAKLVSLAH